MGSAPPPHSRPSLDSVGASASFVCAVHCAVVALFLGAAPAITFLAASWVEWAFLATSAVLGLASLVPGYRVHGLRRPLGLFAVGMTLLISLRVIHARPSVSEMMAVAFAAGCLISAHWINRGARHRCACGPLHH
ncbi:MAG: MerC domain-containing protein [Gemmatimonadaceae bacterium]|nr:MerC domain-containing protein [Gemmatimonadaceae bacterium]